MTLFRKSIVVTESGKQLLDERVSNPHNKLCRANTDLVGWLCNHFTNSISQGYEDEIEEECDFDESEEDEVVWVPGLLKVATILNSRKKSTKGKELTVGPYINCFVLINVY